MLFNVLESTTSNSSNEESSDSNVSTKVFIVLFSISLVVNVVLGIIVWFLWKDRQRLVKIASIPYLSVSCPPSCTQSVHFVFSLALCSLTFWLAIICLTSTRSSLLITCPHHLNLASLTFSAMSTTPHLLIFSYYNVSDQHPFISSYYVSIPFHLSLHCFPHLLCNI